MRPSFQSSLLAHAGICLAVFLGGQSHAATSRAECLPAYDRWFQRTNGWIGGDGNFAVTLTNGLTLWVFSDTFVGEVQNGHRTNATMINNSAAWQHGADPKNSHVEFFYGRSVDARPTALVKPADGKGWFWLFDGAMVQGKLFLFLAQIESTGEKSAFGFRQIGMWLGEVSNPLAPPPQWQVTQTKIPFVRFGGDEQRLFGSAVLVTNGFVYVYGTHSRGGGKAMILARAPETKFEDFSAWQFRTADGWSTNVAAAAELCPNLASEYSVSWLPALRRFVLVCTENGLSEKIITRTANDPWGPWSAPAVAFKCPEASWSRKIFYYSAKAHPMLAAADDELIVTYAANSYDFGELMQDARLYWPRFVRLSPK